MAKRKVKPTKLKVEFIKDFKGCLNERVFNNKLGDILEVHNYELDWLMKHKAIKC